ncbi:MAG TPA: M28 family peptidase [Candidatus Limnocylindria bacterium]|nr:M28 family peptidase [Candidatus Limnocylindria bacterium]
MRPAALGLAIALLVSGCAETVRAVGSAPPSVSPSPASASAIPSPTSTPTSAPAATATASSAPSLSACQHDARCNAIQSQLGLIDPYRMDGHLSALTSFVSRDPRHPGHARAIAYIKEQLGALDYYGLRVETHRTSHQGIALENIFAVIDPAPGAVAPNGASQTPPPPVGPTGWVLVSAHYDSTANRTPGWRPAQDPAPGADDNATGTAALLELARVVGLWRAGGNLRSRLVLAFFDGEELFFKGSGAYVASLQRPYPYKAAVNLDMVGFNPLADRLDLLWYTNASAPLRDRVVKANETYRIGVSPLNAQYAADGSTIMDAAPFGLAGIPSIALCQRYGENDATFPGNTTFHTVNDLSDKITNKRLWLKATKLTLAVALELADGSAE